MRAHWTRLLEICLILMLADGAVAVANSNATLSFFNGNDTLLAGESKIYGVPIAEGFPDPELLVSVVRLAGKASPSLYCNPGYGAYTDALVTIPQPGFAVWSAESSTGNVSVIISPNDYAYRPPGAAIPGINVSTSAAASNYVPFFLCAVANADATENVTFALQKYAYLPTGQIVTPEAAAMTSIFNRCCINATGTSTSSQCRAWKTVNKANGGIVYSNFCRFTGQLCTPEGRVRRLDLSDFDLHCPFPTKEIAAMVSLETLVLAGNPQLSGDFPTILDGLSNLTSLKTVDFTGNTGLAAGQLDIDLSICTLAQRLKTLTLSEIGLEGSLPDCLFANSTISTISLGYNNFTGPIPDTFPATSALQTLNLTSNQLTGTFPASLGNASLLTHIDVSYNSLEGSLADAWGGLSSLKYIGLHYNSFTGALPPSIALIGNLVQLDTKENAFTALPPAWSDPSTSLNSSVLSRLRFSFNSYSGPFPIALATAPYIQSLVLNVNAFSGPLPDIPGMFPQLRSFNVSSNALTGTIPSAFGTSGIFTLPVLQFSDGTSFFHVFDLSKNQLSGTIPSFLYTTFVPAHVASGVALAGNPKLKYTCNLNINYIKDICGGQSSSGVNATVATPAAPGPKGTGFA